MIIADLVVIGIASSQSKDLVASYLNSLFEVKIGLLKCTVEYFTISERTIIHSLPSFTRIVYHWLHKGFIIEVILLSNFKAKNLRATRYLPLLLPLQNWRQVAFMYNTHNATVLLMITGIVSRRSFFSACFPKYTVGSVCTVS